MAATPAGVLTITGDCAFRDIETDPITLSSPAPALTAALELVNVQLTRKVETQEQSLARLAHIIAAQIDLARTVCINELIMRATARCGPIGVDNYELARRVFAAEVDGDPIVFQTLGCDQPIWLRSVIRFVNTHDISLDGTDRGNRMTSRTTTFREWCEHESADCCADVLIIMPLCENSHGYERTSGQLMSGRMPLMSGKCKSETIIFGNAYQNSAFRDTVDEHLEGVRGHLAPWFGLCRVMFAHLAGEGVGSVPLSQQTPIHELNADISRAYVKAVPATGANSITEEYGRGTLAKPMLYPTHITRILGT
jgi:hypothetical protein